MSATAREARQVYRAGRRMGRRLDFIVLDSRGRVPVMRCTHCGGWRELHLPACVQDLLHQERAFRAGHRTCKQKSDRTA